MEAYLEVIIRTFVVYIFIIVAIRLFGKTELTQLSVFDLVFILLISNSVQNAMVGPDSTLAGGLIAAGSLFILNFIIKRISYKSPNFNKFLQGEPIMLVREGAILKQHLEKVKISEGELLAAMREHGVADVKDVDLAILEVDGNISILTKNYQQHTKMVRKNKSPEKK
jgi:uncharacterized membrane protein YcaP (DUF421 family)